MSGPVPLLLPLAGLLAEPPGTERRYDIDGATVPMPEDLRLTAPLLGKARITRTNRGVIVDADFSTSIAASCSRCLRDIEVPEHVEIHEEVLPSIDLATGGALDTSAEPDVARLNGHHELELGTLVAEAISLEEPIAPLCEAACPGLCPTCGERLDPGHPEHEDAPIDPRLAILQGFRVDDAPETG